MENEKDNRTKWLHLRLTPAEHEKLMRRFRKSADRKLSDYARKNLLQKPIIGLYRNQSIEDLMPEMIQIRKELNAIGHNFNQAVKKLHTLSQLGEIKSWIARYEIEKNVLYNKIDQTKNHIAKTTEKWLRS